MNKMLLFLIFLLPISTAAQFFKVNQGNALIGGKMLDKGEILPNNSQISVMVGQKASLSYGNGKILEIIQAGQYAVADLVWACSFEGEATVTNMVQCALKELVAPNGPPKNMRRPFSSSIHSEPSAINFLKHTITYHQPNFAIGYKGVIRYEINPAYERKIDAIAFYRFVFNDLMGSHINTVEMPVPELVTDFSDSLYSLAAAGTLTCKVYANGDSSLSSSTAFIRFVSPKKASYSGIFEQIAAFPTENMAICWLARAYFYESNNLCLQAAFAYDEALRLSGNSNRYAAVKDTFRLRAAPAYGE